MEYGHFIGNGEIYKINEIKTPTPWKNILFNDEYFTEVSQRLCGKSFAVENWDRSPVLDEQKLFYIKIGDKVYQPGSGKSKKYFCEHHIYKSVMTDEFDGFISKITVFVPIAGKREMWNIEIQNKTENDIEAQIFAYFEFANIEYLSLECDHINGYFCKKSFPYHVHYEEYAKLKNKERKTYAMSDKPVKSYECSRDRFFGGDNPFSMPHMVERGIGSNKRCEYENCAAAFHHQLMLAPGNSDSITYIIGQEKNEAAIEKIKRTMPDFQTELVNAERKWNEEISPLQINTEHKDLNALVNYWIKKTSYISYKT